VGGKGAILVDGEDHALRVERRAQVELDVRELLDEELGNLGGASLELLNILLGLAGSSELKHDSVHVLLDPVLEVHGSADLGLSVLETVDDVVDSLNGVINTFLVASAAEGVAASNVDITTTLGDVLRLDAHKALNLMQMKNS